MSRLPLELPWAECDARAIFLPNAFANFLCCPTGVGLGLSCSIEAVAPARKVAIDTNFVAGTVG
jgi:hypothetical protein